MGSVARGNKDAEAIDAFIHMVSAFIEAAFIEGSAVDTSRVTILTAWDKSQARKHKEAIQKIIKEINEAGSITEKRLKEIEQEIN